MRSNRLQLNTSKTEILWCSTIRRQNHLTSVAVRVGENHVLPSTTVRDLGVLIDSDVAMRSHASRTVSGCFAVLLQLRSIRRSVSDSVFLWSCADYATPQLLQRNTRRTSFVSAQSTSIGSQCRRQTDTSIFSVWVRHTNAARPTLAVVSGTHRFQVSCARLLMPACRDATVYFWLHAELVERRRFRPPPSPVVVILAASDPTYTAVHCWWSCVSGCRKPPLEQSAARRHLSFNADCFFETASKLIFFPDHLLPNCFRLLVLHAV